MFKRFNSFIGRKHPVIYLCLLTSILIYENISFLVFSLSISLIVFEVLVKNVKMKQVIGYLFSLISLGLVLYEFNTLLNIEAGMSFLTLLQACKLLTTYHNRDYFLGLNISLFVICGQVLFNQSFMTLLLSFLSVGILLYILFKINNPSDEFKELFTLNMSYNFPLILILSLGLVALYFIFPRFNLSFRNLNSAIGKVGFSNSVKPGEQNEIKMDNSKAFKVLFGDNYRPSSKDLYWIGSILYKTNGYHWSFEKVAPPKLITKKEVSSYEVFSDTLVMEYLFSLYYPGRPEISELVTHDAPYTYKLYRQMTQKVSYKNKIIEYEYEKIKESERGKALKLPSYLKNGRVKELAQKLKGNTVEESLRNILNYFSHKEFIYTLRPGVTSSLGEFLFETRKGFCSHYASAFSILSRLMGVPSRVVAGYQGGIRNEYDGVYTVYQKDAHAWSESYIEGKGWVRFDPVEAIRPDRIELGGSNFFSLSPNGENEISESEYLNMRNNPFSKIARYFETFNNSWTQFMYSYDKSKQVEILEKLSLKWKDLFWILSCIIIFLLFGVYFLLKSVHKSTDSKELRQYKKVLKKLERYGIYKEKSEGPQSMMNKVENSHNKFDKVYFLEEIKKYRKYKYE